MPPAVNTIAKESQIILFASGSLLLTVGITRLSTVIVIVPGLPSTNEAVPSQGTPFLVEKANRLN